ncbi:hypothetical protein SAMN05421767_1042 [Granulicatella balaenopterae]|uniref:Uncharacterized protein n=1 Tax=Granulicatella balaenopterae TaxID=137733 RepID=A0A1H9HYZ2_9LACT|nr:pilin [Granulicatella balaenopterae]SEQ67570.1 hypothetical protein SAMN05421767_1042 [Granulicatella balaenopterae]
MKNLLLKMMMTTKTFGLVTDATDGAFVEKVIKIIDGITGDLVLIIAGIAGGVATFYLAYNGIKIMSGREGATEGKKGIKYALIGLVIAVLAATIVTALRSRVDAFH